MSLVTKAISETVQFREVSLKTKKTYAGGEDIKTRLQSNNWNDVAKKDTEWEE